MPDSYYFFKFTPHITSNRLQLKIIAGYVWGKLKKSRLATFIPHSCMSVGFYI